MYYSPSEGLLLQVTTEADLVYCNLSNWDVIKKLGEETRREMETTSLEYLNTVNLFNCNCGVKHFFLLNCANNSNSKLAGKKNVN